MFYFVFLTSIIPITAIAYFYKDFLNLQFNEATIFILVLLPVIIGVSNISLGFILFNYLTGKASNSESLEKKLQAYQNAFIIRSACIEGVALLTAVCFALTSQDWLLIFSASLFGLLVLLKPSIKEIKMRLKLTPEDLNRLETFSN